MGTTIEDTNTAAVTNTTAVTNTAAALAGISALLAAEPKRLRRRGISLGVPVREADDVAQDIVVRAWRSAASVRSATPGALCAWLDTVARSVVIDSARRRRRVPFTADIDETDIESPRRVEDDVEARQRLRDVHAAIAGLQRSLREPLLLQVEHDLSATEIADRLGISDVAVRQRLARARRILRG